MEKPKEVHFECLKCGHKETVPIKETDRMWSKSIGGYEWICPNCGEITRWQWAPPKGYPTHIDGVPCTGSTNSFILH